MKTNKLLIILILLLCCGLPIIAADKTDGVITPAAQAEDVKNVEADFQNSINAVAAAIDRLEQRTEQIRKSAEQPSKYDVDNLVRDAGAINQEMNKLSAMNISGLGELQRNDLQDRLLQVQSSLNIIKKRINGGDIVFGMDFFSNIPSQQPMDQRPVPFDYKVRVGDRLEVNISSSLGEQNQYKPQVNNAGKIFVPGVGNVNAAGKTVSELESSLRANISKRYKQLNVNVVLDTMASIQVQVSGDVVRPGTYSLSGLATVFSALYQAGGPSSSGSFRKITMIRAGEPKHYIDLYQFLLYGNKKQDVTLQDGDLLFVQPVGDTISINGEVKRPARYEPSFPVTLKAALKMAGGVNAGSYLKSVVVERVENNQYRTLINVDAIKAQNADFQLNPGDVVTVIPVRPDRTNQVAIFGPVSQPGNFGFKVGMRVKDLIDLAQGFAQNKEIYMGRADVLRIEPATGFRIISFDLGLAMKGDLSQNIELQKLDRVYIYNPDQVVFRSRLITVVGAIAKPGIYKRSEGLRVSDIIAASGGLLPNAYTKRVDLLRVTSSETTELIKIDLASAMSGDLSANIALQDRDKLTVYTMDQVNWRDMFVKIEGAVQRPGTYLRAENMRVEDLIFMAGGLLPEAVKKAEIGRSSESGESEVIKVDINNLASADNNIVLKDRDILTIPSNSSVMRSSDVVYITGEVANPGPYSLKSKDEKLIDLVKRAGGVTEYANPEGVLFLRQKENIDNLQQLNDVDNIIKKNNIFADKQFLTQIAGLGVNLPDEFAKMISTSDTKLAKPSEVLNEEKLQEDVNIAESEEHKVASKKYDDMQAIGDVNKAAANKESALGMPMKLDANETIGSFAMNKKLADITKTTRVSINFRSALANADSSDNMMLRNGDRIYIPKATDIVTVVGSVLHPHSFAAAKNQNAAYYIDKSGGYAQDAAAGYTIIVRANGDSLPYKKAKYILPGDTIVVPNSGLIDVAKKWEKIGSVTKVISDVLSSVFVLTKF